MTAASPTRRALCAGILAAGFAPPAPAQRTGAPVRAIVFDALGTLFDTAATVAALDRLVPGRGADLADHWRLKQLEYSWLAAAADQWVPLAEITRRALDHAMAATGTRLTDADIAALLASYARLPAFPDVKPALAALGSTPLAILSASGPTLLTALLAANGLTGTIGHILSTEAARTYKPSPRAYALAERALGVPRATILLVSTNGFDVWGAARYGFRTAWVRRPAAGRPGVYDRLRGGAETLQPSPDHILTSLADLPALLRLPS